MAQTSNHPIMQSVGSEYIISEGNVFRKYRNGQDVYVFWKKLDDNNEEVSDTYFSEIEDDFRLLHKPYSMEVN